MRVRWVGAHARAGAGGAPPPCSLSKVTPRPLGAPRVVAGVRSLLLARAAVVVVLLLGVGVGLLAWRRAALLASPPLLLLLLLW